MLRVVWLALFLMWGGWIGLGSLLVIPTAAAAAPRLEIDQPVYNLGEVFEDQPLEHTFMLKNTGEEWLQIRKIELDCACSLVNYDRQIPPHGVGRIVFKIKPYSVIHQFCKKGEVFSNDPEKPVVVIQLCGRAKPFIEIQPSHIIRFVGNPQESMNAIVRLISHQQAPLKINGIETDLDDKVTVTVKPEKPGKIFNVEVANKIKNPAHYKGKIEILTSSDKRPRLILRVFADLYPSSAGAP
ncbi:DUF1573 domain-containing protein [Desulfobacca acetoxidans]|uniref:DUF1573 domain-containing protein n=1 Tax=Desulfobacca acetoxidans (strain ATCC 700848 / DSM 11109 / ASRB2) TaxID=880072 RepID=F2NIR8_DESAR|nr:DUF1573 domain-containing protein [Desulfobacca acetoxidans]AEB10612.1 protein of unknown function DUF1573 [Desulfobacca acetoxidans DSM 11109]